MHIAHVFQNLMAFQTESNPQLSELMCYAKSITIYSWATKTQLQMPEWVTSMCTSSEFANNAGVETKKDIINIHKAAIYF